MHDEHHIGCRAFKPEAALFFGKTSSFLAEVAKSIDHAVEDNLARMRYQREAPVVATLGPILLLVKLLMGASFHSWGISSVVHTATMMPWNASRILKELSESPTL